MSTGKSKTPDQTRDSLLSAADEIYNFETEFLLSLKNNNETDVKNIKESGARFLSHFSKQRKVIFGSVPGPSKAFEKAFTEHIDNINKAINSVKDDSIKKKLKDRLEEVGYKSRFDDLYTAMKDYNKIVEKPKVSNHAIRAVEKAQAIAGGNVLFHGRSFLTSFGRQVSSNISSIGKQVDKKLEKIKPKKSKNKKEVKKQKKLK